MAEPEEIRFADGSRRLSQERAIRLISRWIRARRPGSVVRFGEGESRLLCAQPNDPASIKLACNKLRRQTGRAFSSDEMFEVRALLYHALDQADVVAIGGRESFADERRDWIIRTERIFASRSADRTKPAFVAHSKLNWPLHAALPALLNGLSRVSVISCRNIAPVIEHEYGISDVRVFQVPSQFVKRTVDGDYESAMHGQRIWPDVIMELEKRLAVRSRGEVFLVGAGLFAKHLCITIRDQGGIAIDIGSSLDAMAGKTTRRWNSEDALS